jgi:hypothetical protein
MSHEWKRLKAEGYRGDKILFFSFRLSLQPQVYGPLLLTFAF